MSRFASTRTKRRTAFTVLLVWLFAMASGWANACLIQAGQPHLQGSTGPETLAVHAHLVSPGHLEEDCDHPENAGAAKSACLKFCGDGSQTIAKPTSGIDLLDLPMTPPVMLAWTAPLADAAPDNAWLEFPAPSPGLPLRTRFSRLAL